MRNPAYVLLGILMISLPVESREFEGLSIPDKVTLADTGALLQLNGVGMRSKFIFDVYVGALYTEKPAVTRDEVLAQKGPKRILMHFVYDEVEADKLVNGWNDGFRENQSEEKLTGLAERIKRFNAMFSTVHAGDVILLDYVPGYGTIVNIRGEKKGVIEGEDFSGALLDIWLGDAPADTDLKQAMLSGH